MTQETFAPRIWLRRNGSLTEISGADQYNTLQPGTELLMLVDGRTPIDAQKKLNPLWWAMNDWDPIPPDWSLPSAPWWLRTINWWWRNPFHNFGRYVLGVGDQNYVVRIYQRDGYDQAGDLQGWEKGELILTGDATSLPWYAYGDKNFVWYWGWQPTGFSGFKLNRAALAGAAIAPVMFVALIAQRAWSCMWRAPSDAATVQQVLAAASAPIRST